MSRIRFIHIDYGSKGTAGLYITQILNSYSGMSSITAFVHSELPHYDCRHRIFRFFDKFSKYIPFRTVRMAWKCIDLYVCFAILILVLRKNSRKNRLVVVVQFFQSFHAYKWFFESIKNFCTLVVTVHDAVELQHSYPALIMSPRDEIIRLADYLIVHNPDSIKHLSYLGKKIIEMPFPLMTPHQPYEDYANIQIEPIQFLFIGHIRHEKGIDTLVNAWHSLPNEITKNAFLTIAGNYSINEEIDFSGLKYCSVILKYLSDDEFISLIKNCHYVVMPYKGGTNSGVLSIASALGKPCITTKIPIFSQSIFYDEELSFSTTHELTQLIVSVIKNHRLNYPAYQKRTVIKCKNYHEYFTKEVNTAHEKISC